MYVGLSSKNVVIDSQSEMQDDDGAQPALQIPCTKYESEAQLGWH